MKKFCLVSLIMILTLTFMACGKEEEEILDGPGTYVVNPMVEVENVAELAATGAKMDIPEGAKNPVMFIISELISQIDFEADSMEICYRGSKSQSGIDLTGVYDEFDSNQSEIHLHLEKQADDEYILIKFTTEGGALATWTYNGVNYSVFAPSIADKDAFEEVVISCANITME